MKIDKISIQSTTGGVITGAVHLSRETTEENIWTINNYQVFMFTAVKGPKINADLPWYIDSASLKGFYMINRHTKQASGSGKLLYSAKWISTPAKIPMISYESVSFIAVAMPITKVREFIQYVKENSRFENNIYKLNRGISQALIGDGVVHIFPCEIQPTRSVQPPPQVILIEKEEEEKEEEASSPKRKKPSPKEEEKTADASSPKKRQKTLYDDKCHCRIAKTCDYCLSKEQQKTLRVQVSVLITEMEVIQVDMTTLKAGLNRKNPKQDLKGQFLLNAQFLKVVSKVSTVAKGVKALKDYMCAMDPETLKEDSELITLILALATKVEKIKARCASLQTELDNYSKLFNKN